MESFYEFYERCVEEGVEITHKFLYSQEYKNYLNHETLTEDVFAFLEARDECPIALLMLADIRKRGWQGLNKRNDTSHLYLKAGELGSAYGMYKYADWVFRIREANFTPAIPFYERAVELGSVTAMLELARYYDNRREYEKAIPFYQCASELDSSAATLSLAKLLYNERDMDEAIYYFAVYYTQTNEYHHLNDIFVNNYGHYINFPKVLRRCYKMMPKRFIKEIFNLEDLMDEDNFLFYKDLIYEGYVEVPQHVFEFVREHYYMKYIKGETGAPESLERLIASY